MTPASLSVMTPANVGSVPSKGTKRRTIRIEDALWDAASSVAAARGESLSDAIRKYLVVYADGLMTAPALTDAERAEAVRAWLDAHPQHTKAGARRKNGSK